MNSTGGATAIATKAAVPEGRSSQTTQASRAGVTTLIGPRSNGRIAQVGRFGWHFVQMAIAMMVGMCPLSLVLSAVGHRNLSTQSPEVYALVMTVAMLLPMVGWMRVLRHSWGRTAEMAAAMTMPVVVVAASSLIGPLPHTAALSMMHVAMWVGMLGAMLVRWREYAQGCHGRAIRERADA